MQARNQPPQRERYTRAPASVKVALQELQAAEGKGWGVSVGVGVGVGVRAGDAKQMKCFG